MRERELRIRFLNCSKTGFTVVELIVALAVACLLMSLLLPMVQASRERARALQCANNLKQIGTACHNFESTHGRFPPTDLLGESAKIRSGSWPAPNTHRVSAQFALLPFLDYSGLYRQFNFVDDKWSMDADPHRSTKNDIRLLESSIPVFGCLSDSLQNGDVSYLISGGTSGGGYITTPEPASNAALIGFGSNEGASPAEISDGLANTAAFSERFVGDKNSARYTPARDWAYVRQAQGLPVRPDDFVKLCSASVTSSQPHASYCGSPWLFQGLGTSNYNHILTPNSRIPDCSVGGMYGPGAYTPRSFHRGGVYVLFADGAVRLVSEAIDSNVWRALGTINSAEAQANL